MKGRAFHGLLIILMLLQIMMCLGKYFPTPEVCVVPQTIKQHVVAQSNLL